MPDPYVYRYAATDPRLGRHVLHDPASRGYPLRVAETVDQSTWVTKVVRIYDPIPNPNQTIGDCTGCAKAMMLNGVGNRVKGVILGLTDADRIYSLATKLDPFTGEYPPTDTGSDGLSAAKAAQQLGLAGAYEWIFNGADGVVQAIQAGHVVNVGTRWDNNMFTQDAQHFVHPGGGVAGGHEWTIHGYSVKLDALRGRCWWGDFRDFWIKRSDLAELLADQGDAHVQVRA